MPGIGLLSVKVIASGAHRKRTPPAIGRGKRKKPEHFRQEVAQSVSRSASDQIGQIGTGRHGANDQSASAGKIIIYNIMRYIVDSARKWSPDGGTLKN